MHVPFKIIVLLLCTFIFLQPSFPSDSADPLIVLDNQELYEISPNHIAIYLDSEDLMAEQVIHKDFEASAVEAYGYEYQTIWLLIKIDNQSSRQNILLVDRYGFDTYELYTKLDNQWISAGKDGWMVNAEHREMAYRYANTEIPLLSGSQEILIRIKTDTSVQFNWHIVSENALLEIQSNENFLFGLFYGLILVLILYNFILYLTTKFRFYLPYLGYALAMLLLQFYLHGYGALLLWPDAPLFNVIIGFQIPSLIWIMVIQLFSDLLVTKHKNKQSYKFLKIMQIILISFFLLGFILLPRIILIVTNIMNLFLSCSIFSMSINLIRKKFKLAWAFAFPMGLTFVILVSFQLHIHFGILFDVFNHPFFLIVTTAQLFLFATAVGYRFNILKLRTERSEKLLAQINNSLEAEIQIRAKEIDEKNGLLNNAFIDLHNTQHQLIKKEKLANLSTLVTGVAHELNTPLGNGITATSFLNEQIKEVLLKKNDLSIEIYEKLRYLLDAGKIVENNLVRATSLVQGFKELSSDSISTYIRSFNLKTYLDKLFFTLQHELKTVEFKFEYQLDESFEYLADPSSFSTVFTNLIMNSLKHGFDNILDRKISICVYSVDDLLQVEYRDNGNGIEEELVKNVFDPFFTTKRDTDGIGLGLYMVRKTVTKNLNGQIELAGSSQGVYFIISLPLNFEKQ